MNNKTILIVDDTPLNIDILEEILEDYDVLAATNGQDALDIVNEEHIDLILLDIMMPDMNGYEVCQKLKANKYSNDIPVIFITSSQREASMETAYGVGGVDYINKPFDPKEILLRVSTCLSLHNKINTESNECILDQNYTWNYDINELLFNDEFVRLTTKERKILKLFFTNINHTFTYDDIANQIWDMDFDDKTNAIKLLIKSLRKKLPEGTIENVYGIGYKVIL